MPLRVAGAYLGVILIWSTTPLAIKWSGEGVGFLFGVTARMVLGALLAVSLAGLLRVPVPLHAAARRTYLASALGLYGSMMAVYWGAQFIPSGWISVVFGLMPILTSALAAVWLYERAFEPHKLLGMLLGFGGLAVIFARGLALGVEALWGLLAVLLAVSVQAASTVLVKRAGARLPALAVTAGGLAAALPAYLLSWWLLGGEWPRHIPTHALGSILYLGVFGSVLGFFFYYYALRHVQASRIALITLITPISALLIGHRFNGEPIGARVWAGAALVLAGLLAYQWGRRPFESALRRFVPRRR